MIKLVCPVTRRADVTPEAFHAYWLGQHGPLVADQAQALGIRKYVQSHRMEHPANEALRSARGMLPALDGVAEVWWDSLADMQAALASEEGAQSARMVAADEAKFVDFARSCAFLTEEHLIFDRAGGTSLGPGAIKVVYLLSCKDGLPVAECHRTWLHDHGRLAAGFAEVSHLARYIQSHAIEPELNDSIRAARGSATSFDGLTEIWLDSPADLKRGVATEEGRQAAATLAEDERRFVQMDRSHCFVTREHVVFDRTHDDPRSTQAAVVQVNGGIIT